jgi:nicotinate-nucleotide pyrophosphorylase (carboxylating)
MTEFVAAALLLTGAAFTLVGGLGVLRMPDLLLRMHATTKAGALGAGLVALSAAVYFAETAVVVRAISILAFVVITAPIAAHVIGRAGYFKGVPLWERSVKDALKDKLDVKSGYLASGLEGAKVDEPYAIGGKPRFHAPDPATVARDVSAALAEDIGSGDLTARLVPEDRWMSAEVVCREDGVLCGSAWFDAVFQTLDHRVRVEWLLSEGMAIAANTTLCRLRGPARALLSGERTAINFLQTLSGTATQTKRYVRAVAHTGAFVLDTRKTLPGLRAAQKYAVRCGGGHNHRQGLYDAILIKENHIHACGSIASAVATARRLHPGVSVEVETENLDEVHQALQAGADRIMLDDFSLEQIREACAVVAAKARIEVSGGVDLASISAIAEAGADDVSIGAITKHVRALDLSMRFINERGV